MCVQGTIHAGVKVARLAASAAADSGASERTGGIFDTSAGVQFWQSVDTLAADHPLVTDRTAGSRHPPFPDLVDPIACGYLDGTSAVNAGGVDVWVGSLGGRTVTGVVCTVDLCKHDAGLEVLIGCSADEIRRIEAVHNDAGMAALLVTRPGYSAE